MISRYQIRDALVRGYLDYAENKAKPVDTDLIEAMSHEVMAEIEKRVLVELTRAGMGTGDE